MSDPPFEVDPGPVQPSAAHPPVPDSGGKSAEHRRGPARWLAWLTRIERDLAQIGTEPDPRNTFANERTFLAWNRTALALIAAGLAAAQFLNFNLHGLRLIIAVPLIVLGGALALASYSHWQDSERAMRLRRPLRYSWMPLVLTGGIVVIALGGAILAVVDRLLQ
jgi:putative membrane protein